MVTVLQVAWLDQNSIPLTYEERRVIDDSRFSVVRPLVRDWNLQLQDVRLDDAGVYRCTVNTKPIASKVVSLLVTGKLHRCCETKKTFSSRADSSYFLTVTFVPVSQIFSATKFCCLSNITHERHTV